MQVEGSYSYNDVPSDNAFYVRVGFRCPYCHARHAQSLTGTGTAADGIEVECDCGQGSCWVVPYRSALAKGESNGNHALQVETANERTHAEVVR